MCSAQALIRWGRFLRGFYLNRQDSLGRSFPLFCFLFVLLRVKIGRSVRTGALLVSVLHVVGTSRLRVYVGLDLSSPSFLLVLRLVLRVHPSRNGCGSEDGMPRQW